MTGNHHPRRRPSPHPPLICRLCEAPRYNDDSVRWLYLDGFRLPYCADGCAEVAEAGWHRLQEADAKRAPSTTPHVGRHRR